MGTKDDHLQSISECPDCASENIVHSTMRDQVICRDCGLVFEPFTPMDIKPVAVNTAHAAKAKRAKPAKKAKAKKAKPAKKTKKAKAKSAKPAKKSKPAKKAKKSKSKSKKFGWW